MFKYPARRLETGVELECCGCWYAGTLFISDCGQVGLLKDEMLIETQFLFLEPNASDPLNKEAAEDLRTNRENFRRNVKTSMTGGSVKGIVYDRVLIR